MRRNFLLSPLGKSLNIIEKVEGLSLVSTSFASGDSPRPVFFVLTMSLFSTGLGVSMYCERYLWGRKFELFYLNQPLCTPRNLSRMTP